tara:strand:+ start:81 stop:356 length:276 start_codon:yes stop_codon:yes gene_type:complete
MLSEYQERQAKLIAQRAKRETEERDTIFQKQKLIKPEKEIYTEEINPAVSDAFSKMVDDEIIRMGFDPVIKRKEWDKETEINLQNSKYKNI